MAHSAHLHGSEDAFMHGHRHAPHPMHRPGPHNTYGGHHDQNRGAATEGFEYGDDFGDGHSTHHSARHGFQKGHHGDHRRSASRAQRNAIHADFAEHATGVGGADHPASRIAE